MKKVKLKKQNKRLLLAIERLEAENMELRLDIDELCERPRSLKSRYIKLSNKIRNQIEFKTFLGDAGPEPKLRGLFFNDNERKIIDLR